ncbi:hypothetical protein EV695_3992 [Cocleimonas flava]|uniref:Uncharacterized protein n=1 Tax=Cocleimonas flava TaxID=634765 RepID=A0A4R1ETJ1_9GAMM|nr:hypothetical protein EV695_3992 [Cocleimonas flava]
MRGMKFGIKELKMQSPIANTAIRKSEYPIAPVIDKVAFNVSSN